VDRIDGFVLIGVLERRSPLIGLSPMIAMVIKESAIGDLFYITDGTTTQMMMVVVMNIKW